MKELTPDLDLGIGIDFSDPRGIGADRLANAVGVDDSLRFSRDRSRLWNSGYV